MCIRAITAAFGGFRLVILPDGREHPKSGFFQRITKRWPFETMTGFVKDLHRKMVSVNFVKRTSSVRIVNLLALQGL